MKKYITKRRVVGVALIIAGIVIAIAGCGTAATGAHTTTKIACLVQYEHWRKHGGLKDVYALKSAVGTMYATGKNHHPNQLELQAEASDVNDAAKTVDSHLPPNCVPKVDTDLVSMVSDVNSAAQQTAKNNPTGAQAQLKDAEMAFKRLTVDINTYLHS